MNLKSQYEACSFDKLKINKAADRTASVNGKADIVNGKYKLLKILLLLLYLSTNHSLYISVTTTYNTNRSNHGTGNNVNI